MGDRHVSAGQLEELADRTHAHAWQRGVDDEPDWRVYHDGILGWWSIEADLSDEERYRLHKFRSD